MVIDRFGHDFGSNQDMKVSVSDIANWAQILSLPAALLAWLITKERAAQFWKKWQKWIFGSLVIFVLAMAIIRLRWLDWLFRIASVPVWVLILLGIWGLLPDCAIRMICHLLRKPVVNEPAVIIEAQAKRPDS